MINSIQIKSFCVHNICVCTVYIYYLFINTCIYFRKINELKLMNVKVNEFKIFIFNIKYKNINIYMQMHAIIFYKYILYVCVFMYT